MSVFLGSFGPVAMMSGGPNPYAVTYLGKIAWSSGNTISGSIDIGAADPDKEIFLLSTTTSTSSRTLTAATTTVDSVAVTKFTTEHLLGGGSDMGNVAGGFVAMPTQSGSVTITATYSGALGSGTVFVYKVVSRPGYGTNQSDSSSDSSIGGGGGASQLVFSSTTIPANGIWFACKAHNKNAASTWDNGSLDDTRTDALPNTFDAAHRGPQASSSTPTDTFSWTGGNALGSGASWSFA